MSNTHIIIYHSISKKKYQISTTNYRYLEKHQSQTFYALALMISFLKTNTMRTRHVSIAKIFQRINPSSFNLKMNNSIRRWPLKKNRMEPFSIPICTFLKNMREKKSQTQLQFIGMFRVLACSVN